MNWVMIYAAKDASLKVVEDAVHNKPVVTNAYKLLLGDPFKLFREGGCICEGKSLGYPSGIPDRSLIAMSSKCLST